MKAGWLKLVAKGLADQWQIPTFLLAVLVGAASVWSILAHQKRTSLEEAIIVCEQLAENEHYAQAELLASKLLSNDQLKPDQRVHLHGLAARAIYETEKGRQTPSEERLKAFHRHFAQTAEGQSPTPQEHVMLGDVARWTSRYSTVVNHYQIALDNDYPDRISLLKYLIELLPRTGRDYMDPYIDSISELLEQENLSDQDRVWAMDLKTELLFREGKFSEAVELISEALPRVENENDQLYLQYSLALGQYYEGKYDQAELRLRYILDRLTARDDLDAKVSLLLGRICSKEHRPQEAGAFFQQVIDAHRDSEYHLAALVGKAEACADLHRFNDSQSYYRQALGLYSQLGANALITRDEILSSIEQTGSQLALQDRPEEALPFAYLHYDHLDSDDDQSIQTVLGRMAAWHRLVADSLSRVVENVGLAELADQMRQKMLSHYRKAGDYFLQLSNTAGLLDRNAAQVLWQAALSYERAELPDQFKTVLETFVYQWPNDPLLPEALFRLGGWYRAENDLEQAEQYYQRLIDEFQRTPWGLQSLVPLAETYFQMGSTSYPQAENILMEMVDDTSNQQLFDPRSIQFQTALFLLGKVHYYQDEFEKCISRLEEALQRYPDSRSVPEARFLMAQSYRKLAERSHQLLGQTNDRDLKDTLIRNRQENLKRAQELYQSAAASLEVMERRSGIEETYLKLTSIYAADCLYDLGQFERAIRAYEKTIERFEKTSIALDSYVQIINAYQRMGQWGKIRAVLERMKWLLRQLPDAELARSVKSFSREDWDAWIEWNYDSGLLDEQSPPLFAQRAGDVSDY